MSGGAKLAIGITVLVVLYIVWDWFSKKSEETKKKEEEKKAEACTELEDYEYFDLYKKRFHEEQAPLFYRNDLPQQQRWDLMRAMRDAYRQEAYMKGAILPNTNDTENQIAFYIIWKKTGEAMLADGYCKKDIGGWREMVDHY